MAPGLLDEVDLEADEEVDLARVGPRDGNDGDEIDERAAILAIVDEARLAFAESGQMPFEVLDGAVVRVLTFGARLERGAGGLEEAAVFAEDLVERITVRWQKVSLA